ncbi:MAG: biopolymer transporter ExbD [Pedobacter sp.]|nr:MAG: biopolymer transporter ExbD [Pedobacter sp.]
MAELNISLGSKAVKGRTKKPLPKVDLTAMVDLAFLLITFFMLTTSLSKMKSLDIVKPAPAPDTIKYHFPSSRTMTILLGKNNQAVYYMGETAKAVMKTVDMKRLKSEILANKLIVQQTHSIPKDKEMLVIIKPTNTSRYKNFVDAIDEMSVANILSYAIDDKYFSVQEQDFMKAKGI